MNDPLKGYNDLIKAAQIAQRAFSPTQSLAEQIANSMAFSSIDRSDMAAIMAEERRRRSFLDSGLGIEQLLSQARLSQELAKQMRTNFQSPFPSIAERTNDWQSLFASAVQRTIENELSKYRLANIMSSFSAWESSAAKLAESFGSIGLIQSNPALAERLLAPSQVFSDFSQSTLVRLDKTTDARQISALATSLQLAEAQLCSATDLLNEFVAVPDNECEITSAQGLNSLYVQQEELLETADEDSDGDDAGLPRPTAATNAIDLSRAILADIILCNEARKVAGHPEIFKPTTRVLEVYADLPWLIASDKESFAQFVDYLYFLFYEGAGKDKLRFLKTHGGPIDDDDFEFVLCIKHLRNKWTRHDADHGNESAIQKSWAELSKKFECLGLARIPITQDDYRLLHINLLVLASGFIKKILSGTISQ